MKRIIFFISFFILGEVSIAADSTQNNRIPQVSFYVFLFLSALLIAYIAKDYLILLLKNRSKQYEDDANDSCETENSFSPGSVKFVHINNHWECRSGNKVLMYNEPKLVKKNKVYGFAPNFQEKSEHILQSLPDSSDIEKKTPRIVPISTSKPVSQKETIPTEKDTLSPSSNIKYCNALTPGEGGKYTIASRAIYSEKKDSSIFELIPDGDQMKISICKDNMNAVVEQYQTYKGAFESSNDYSLNPTSTIIVKEEGRLIKFEGGGWLLINPIKVDFR